MEALAALLEASALGQWARGSAVAYPVANVAHLLGLVLLLGGIGVVDLRLAGLWRGLPVQTLSRALTPWAVGGLILLAASGSVMFAADAGPMVSSNIFRAKVALIVVGLLHAVLFHWVWRRRMADWETSPPLAGRLMAVGSLGVWLTVGALGRLIAYA
ncbi:DUF6644 family protein [Phenylobacterium sp.]|uniref:DUF6644 family protein n=1 Tax=Phenylobacterium sp. TaxID=1871053 RepID=UPI0027316A4C|nr:DUF6644 family protein [Phenylobacterium sp.]MDP1873274.1 hypothetical protein [Phenylobacterium sp.]MDP3299076.1 hypothetical protein [Phenylobacterium sp.]MDP3635001.1 hypothetical protein [Phenylobacterium sp.]